MSNDLTIGILKDDVRTQLEASRQVLMAIRKLKEFAQTEEASERQDLLNEVIEELSESGTKLANNARTTGASLARILQGNRR